MNTQYLQYVREQLIVATADLSGATKGQLLAWLENAQFDTKTFKRKKPRVMDEVTGEMITWIIHLSRASSHAQRAPTFLWLIMLSFVPLHGAGP